MARTWTIFDSKEQREAFDRRADEVFKAIPEHIRALHKDEMVAIAADMEGPIVSRCVFGKTAKEVKERANIHFPISEPVLIMYMGTVDGIFPTGVLKKMRGY